MSGPACGIIRPRDWLLLIACLPLTLLLLIAAATAPFDPEDRG